MLKNLILSLASVILITPQASLAIQSPDYQPHLSQSFNANNLLSTSFHEAMLSLSNNSDINEDILNELNFVHQQKFNSSKDATFRDIFMDTFETNGEIQTAQIKETLCTLVLVFTLNNSSVGIEAFPGRFNRFQSRGYIESTYTLPLNNNTCTL